MKSCVILGDRSEIVGRLKALLVIDDWQITGWNRWTPHKDLNRYFPPWNLLICAIGSVAPVGHWATRDPDEWEASIKANCLLPVRLLREAWHNHLPGASVCFLAGANPNCAGINYSAYYTGKMALLKAVENMDAETPDAKMFALAPGIVFTKIHAPTYASGIINEGLEERKKVGGTPIEKIYECLKWCVAQPKEVVGGRNICVTDRWGDEGFGEVLGNSPSMFKLRRVD